jgi:hypothetical protein
VVRLLSSDEPFAGVVYRKKVEFPRAFAVRLETGDVPLAAA